MACTGLAPVQCLSCIWTPTLQALLQTYSHKCQKGVTIFLSLLPTLLLLQPTRWLVAFNRCCCIFSSLSTRPKRSHMVWKIMGFPLFWAKSKHYLSIMGFHGVTWGQAQHSCFSATTGLPITAEDIPSYPLPQIQLE